MDQQVYLEFASLEGRHWWFRARRKYLTRIIASHFPAKVDQSTKYQFCEIGCGTGGNIPMLAMFAEVDAVEMNAPARDLVRGKNICGLRELSDGSLPSDISVVGDYDGVFSLDVIEHVDQDLAALRRLTELVKPTGFVITTVPAYQWLWSEHDVANHHKRRYTLKQYRQLILDAGLEVHYASYFNTLLFPLAVASRFISRIMPNQQSNSEGTLSMPPPFLNKLFLRVFSLESLWAGRVAMPFGLSIVMVASRPEKNND